jgi:hemolysin activation/secretion protein
MLLRQPSGAPSPFGRCAAFALLLLGACGFLPSLALAAAPTPDAGQVLQNIKPVQPAAPAAPAAALPESAPAAAPAATGGSPIPPITAFHISGASAFSEAELQKLLADAIGQSLTIDEIKARIERITVYYRNHGYLLARALLPPQQIRDGSVQVRVLEGQLGQLNVNNRSLLSDAAVRRQLQQLPEGKPVKAAALDRDLLLLNELPGAVVRSTLKPGEAVGSSDLDVTVNPGKRVNGVVTVDNDGNRYTGSNRFVASLRVNSPARQGDSLLLQTELARGIDYGRVAYQIPVGAYGTQLGGAASLLDYKLGSDFSALRARGAANDYNLLAQQPLVRNRAGSLDLGLTVDHKRLNDVIDSTASISRKGVNSASLSLSGQHRDNFGGGGSNSGSLTLTDGHIKLDAAAALGDSLGHHTAGHYDKLSWQFGRQQYLTSSMFLSGSLSGQWASRNLDSTEKMGLGGASGVRAYEPGEGSSDEALLARLELRYALTTDWQAGPFVDGARGLLNKHPLASDPSNGKSLAGEGVALYWSHRAFAMQVFTAWRNGAAPTVPTHDKLQAGVQLTAYY